MVWWSIQKYLVHVRQICCTEVVLSWSLWSLKSWMDIIWLIWQQIWLLLTFLACYDFHNFFFYSWRCVYPLRHPCLITPLQHLTSFVSSCKGLNDTRKRINERLLEKKQQPWVSNWIDSRKVANCRSGLINFITIDSLVFNINGSRYLLYSSQHLKSSLSLESPYTAISRPPGLGGNQARRWPLQLPARPPRVRGASRANRLWRHIP